MFDWVIGLKPWYPVPMDWKTRIRRWVKERGIAVGLFFGLWGLVSCAGNQLHQGRAPFSLLEFSPMSSKGSERALAKVAATANELQVGDVVAFWMGHDEALGYLRRGVIQKVPYEVFQYGHLALVVEAPDGSGEKRLLQVAMRQAVNVDDGLEYLDDKQWNVFRPPVGSVDEARLGEFVELVTRKASDPKRAYDYGGVLGWKNAPYQPNVPDEVGESYSCATLVIAALHYAGYELDAVHRKGRLDVVTPKQVVMSWAEVE